MVSATLAGSQARRAYMDRRPANDLGEIKVPFLSEAELGFRKQDFRKIIKGGRAIVKPGSGYVSTQSRGRVRLKMNIGNTLEDGDWQIWRKEEVGVTDGSKFQFLGTKSTCS